MANILDTSSTPKTLTDTVYRQMRRDIISGKLAPETKLRIEHIRKEYEVGATPLREALSRLSADGFVETEGQRGFRVTALSIADLDDITELRITLELKALRQSVEAGDELWESGVVSSYYQLTKLESGGVYDVPEWEQRNHDFHWALLAACTSPWLLRFYGIVYDQHKRYRNLSLSTSLQARDVHAEHEQIYQAALARDLDLVCAASEQHIRLTADISRQRLADSL